MSQRRLRPGSENVYSVIVDSLIETVSASPEQFNYRMFSKDMSLSLAAAFSDCNSVEVKGLLRRASEHVNEVYMAAGRHFCSVLLFDVVTESRLLVHVKSPFMPLELGLAWHPFYNLPYIPATTLKGAVRSFMERSNRSICGMGPGELFGVKDSMSRLVFFDAFPVGCSGRLLEADVLTPHYPEVSGVVDEVRVRPNPIVFPVVASGVRFRFIVGVRGVPRDSLECLLRELPGLLREAFEYGIGAKTSIGYGAVQLALGSSMEGEC